MKAITLHQPYASAIALGLKRYETRSWKTKYTGPLAIHAGWADLDTAKNLLSAKYGLHGCPRGVIVAVVDLLGCYPAANVLDMPLYEYDFGDFTPGRYAWELANVRVLAEPYPILGHQGLWDAPVSYAKMRDGWRMYPANRPSRHIGAQR